MTETALNRFWELVGGALALNPDTFRSLETLDYSTRTALIVVLLAGFSQAIGQGIVLFMNRVKPFRFVLSLVIAAILFAFGYMFWTMSTWLAGELFFTRGVSLDVVTEILGFAYAPQLLSFFVALPYLGVPIGIVLSIWSFLASLIGLQVALELDLWQAFWCGILGWVVFEILQRTIGRPVAAIGRWVANTTAGVSLITNLQELEKIVETGMQQVSQPKKPPSRR